MLESTPDNPAMTILSITRSNKNSANASARQNTTLEAKYKTQQKSIVFL